MVLDSISPAAAVASGALILLLARWFFHRDPLDSIPTVGVQRIPFGSFFARFRSVTHTKDWLDEGFRTHRGGIFKIRQIYGWTVVVASSALCDELAKAPEDVLSFQDAAAENIESDYTLTNWRDARGEPHIALIRNRLTKSLGKFFPAVVEEIAAACADHLSVDKSTEWTPIVAADAIMAAIARTTNRIIIGQPLCRNAEWIDLNVRFTRDVIISAMLLKLFPWFLKPLVYRFLTPMGRDYADAMRLVGSFVKGRLEETEMHSGDWAEKPDDMLQWTLDLAIEDERGLERRLEFLVHQVLRLNFSSLHTTATSFVHAFYRVAAFPDIQDPLRKEVEAGIARFGWTKDAVDAMPRLDSLFRETQRYLGLGALSMTRITTRAYTFSNGVTVPARTLVAAASRPVHFDAEVYEDPEAFKPFRFADEAMSAKRALFVQPGVNYIPFGTGKHTCPGRFWAANEMKVLMAHLLLHYDFHTKELGKSPPERWFGPNIVPDQKAEILFKRRSAQ